MANLSKATPNQKSTIVRVLQANLMKFSIDVLNFKPDGSISFQTPNGLAVIDRAGVARYV